jgi:hypothetical protein
VVVGYLTATHCWWDPLKNHTLSKQGLWSRSGLNKLSWSFKEVKLEIKQSIYKDWSLVLSIERFGSIH